MKRTVKYFVFILIAGLIVQNAACSTSTSNTIKPVYNPSLKKIDTGKKILVVYYSKTGNTERVAHDIAETFSSDIEKIVDKKDRSGCIGWFIAGKDGMKENQTDIEPVKYDPSKYDMVILGSPVWGWNMTPAIRAYIEQNRKKFKEIAFFITAGNTTIEKVLPYLEKLTEKKAVAHIGFVSKELDDNALYVKKITVFLNTFIKANK
jgi:flavodoxin